MLRPHCSLRSMHRDAVSSRNRCGYVPLWSVSACAPRRTRPLSAASARRQPVDKAWIEFSANPPQARTGLTTEGVTFEAFSDMESSLVAPNVGFNVVGGFFLARPDAGSTWRFAADGAFEATFEAPPGLRVPEGALKARRSCDQMGLDSPARYARDLDLMLAAEGIATSSARGATIEVGTYPHDDRRARLGRAVSPRCQSPWVRIVRARKVELPPHDQHLPAPARGAFRELRLRSAKPWNTLIRARRGARLRVSSRTTPNLQRSKRR